MRHLNLQLNLLALEGCLTYFESPSTGGAFQSFTFLSVLPVAKIRAPVPKEGHHSKERDMIEGWPKPVYIFVAS